jgi:hypothetical protein
MAAHKGPAILRPKCTRGGRSVAAIPVYGHTQRMLVSAFFWVVTQREVIIPC